MKHFCIYWNETITIPYPTPHLGTILQWLESNSIDEINETYDLIRMDKSCSFNVIVDNWFNKNFFGKLDSQELLKTRAEYLLKS